MLSITKALNLLFAPRLRAIDNFRRRGVEVQHKQLLELLAVAEGTCFGRDHKLTASTTPEQFAQQVPVSTYEEMAHYINRARTGESDLLFKGKVHWFAKSSGTTDSISKYIPVTKRGLQSMHLKGPRDVVALYCHNNPSSRILNGYTLTLGGSSRLDDMGGGALSGDLSAILIANTPKWLLNKRQPDAKTALIPDFDQKVEAICRKVTPLDVTAFAGVPSWNLVMMNRILEYTQKQNLLEVWPNMELFMHGGMNFKPYRKQYESILPSDQMHYMETYNASEGFFAIQDDPTRDDMLLMLDYNMYYEFLPVEELSDRTKAVPLEGVEVGRNYAIIISNACGLWRYMIGDTVEFTSTDPYRIRISGRTKLFINAFGEELIIDNAEEAILAACRATSAQIFEYSAAPIYMDGHDKGSHQWVIEFVNRPNDMALFAKVLDETLRQVNSDYQAKRHNDTTLLMPTITELPKGTFMQWMASCGKLGGQNKVPRLCNDRHHIDQLLKIVQE